MKCHVFRFSQFSYNVADAMKYNVFLQIKNNTFLSGPKIQPYQRLKDHQGHPMNILSKAHTRKWCSEPDRKDTFEMVSERKT